MYRCDHCNRQSPPKKPEIIRNEYRTKFYQEHGTKGREIKRQLKLCPKCAKKFDANVKQKEEQQQPRKEEPKVGISLNSLASAFGIN